jgi:hypothetical protein
MTFPIGGHRLASGRPFYHVRCGRSTPSGPSILTFASEQFESDRACRFIAMVVRERGRAAPCRRGRVEAMVGILMPAESAGKQEKPRLVARRGICSASGRLGLSAHRRPSIVFPELTPDASH